MEWAEREKARRTGRQVARVPPPTGEGCTGRSMPVWLGNLVV